MRITFCGGAGEVGASCYLVEAEGRRILLDCGVRMGNAKDPLPDFRLIQEHGGVDAVVLSHAHLDHSGALPIISREYPQAPIFMTHATKDLVRALLYDSLKIMAQEEEIPIYAEKHVELMLKRIVCYSPQTYFTVPDSGIQLSFYQAGHILGAAAVELKSAEGTLFFSGDISFARQHTVGGAAIGKLRPDVAVFESTYGDKLHANRQGEELRLVETVKEAIASGGKVLIPAFALGRAQEVIMILQRAMNKGIFPECQVWVDGMVREICRVYRLNPNYLPERLAKRVWREGEIFFSERIQPVTNPEMRREIAEGKDPCVIISSSGMLSGGPSQYYAQKLAPGEDNLIAITGYQDEEAPGRGLLDLMNSPGERRLSIGQLSLPVASRIEKYNLSAHADRGELINLAHALSPRRIFLVHGEREITETFGRLLQSEIWGQVELPANGQSVELDVRNPRKQRQRLQIPCLLRDELPEEDDLQLLWEHLLAHDYLFPSSPEQLLGIWQERAAGEEQVKAMFSLLSGSPYFQQDPRRPFLFRPLSPAELEPQEAGPMEVNRMLALADEYFPADSGLYKKGARLEEGKVLLTFKFPRLAREKYQRQLAEFQEATGWEVQLNENCNLQAAQEVLRSLLPQSAQLLKFSYYPEEEAFRATLTEELPAEPAAEFYRQTGHRLSVQVRAPQKLELTGAGPTEPLEQNQAFALLDQAFLGQPDQPHKKSLKHDQNGRYIELAFLTPQVGEKYRELLDRLECRTLWQLKISPAVNQAALLSLARETVEQAGGVLKKNPSYIAAQKKIRISLEAPLPRAEQTAAEFWRLTGITLELN